LYPRFNKNQLRETDKRRIQLFGLDVTCFLPPIKNSQYFRAFLDNFLAKLAKRDTPQSINCKYQEANVFPVLMQKLNFKGLKLATFTSLLMRLFAYSIVNRTIVLSLYQESQS
jgi:hypothetical protein